MPTEKEISELLKQFISFASTEDSEISKQECIDWVVTAFLQDQLENMKKGSVKGSPWVYVKHPKSKLLVFAHLDVVPADKKMFTLQVEGDKAMGRGVSDMKGHILPFLMAYKDACAAGVVPPVSILLTTDEEVAGPTIPQLLNEGVFTNEPAAFTPDSNDIGIVTEHKGAIWADMVCVGSGGHGAYPWDTKNPYWLYAQALQKIQAAFPAGQHDDWHMTVTPTMVKAGEARNQVPDIVRGGIDIRYTPEEHATSESALQAVQKVLPNGVTLEVVQAASPLFTPKNNPIVTLYKEVAESVLGESIAFKKEHGGTDARSFSEQGIPAFLYGPKGGGLHSQDEWVSLSSLKNHYAIYRELFSRL